MPVNYRLNDSIMALQDAYLYFLEVRASNKPTFTLDEDVYLQMVNFTSFTDGESVDKE